MCHLLQCFSESFTLSSPSFLHFCPASFSFLPLCRFSAVSRAFVRLHVLSLFPFVVYFLFHHVHHALVNIPAKRRLPKMLKPMDQRIQSSVQANLDTNKIQHQFVQLSSRTQPPDQVIVDGKMLFQDFRNLLSPMQYHALQTALWRSLKISTENSPRPPIDKGLLRANHIIRLSRKRRESRHHCDCYSAQMLYRCDKQEGLEVTNSKDSERFNDAYPRQQIFC
jgi:hypothetical protein